MGAYSLVKRPLNEPISSNLQVVVFRPAAAKPRKTLPYDYSLCTRAMQMQSSLVKDSSYRSRCAPTIDDMSTMVSGVSVASTEATVRDYFVCANQSIPPIFVDRTNN